MRMDQSIGRGVRWAVLAAACLTGVAVSAHSVTYQGTVVAVEPAKLQVKTVANKTTKAETLWFVVDRDTKVKRGDKTVTFADAKIVNGERIAVTIDHDAEVKMLATDIRLAAAK